MRKSVGGSLVGEPGQESEDLGHVGASDAMMLRLEKDPQLRTTTTAVIVFDGVPDRAAVSERVERMSHSVPGCRHRLVSPPLGLATPVSSTSPEPRMTRCSITY
jgi:hypothetical protein